MSWRSVTMKEERLEFVLEALNFQYKKPFIELCRNYNISPKTGYKWLNRFLKDGEKGLEELSRAPFTNSRQILPEIKECVISIKKEFPKWGPKKIHAELLNNFAHLPLPSEGSIGNILSENGLVKSRFYRRHVALTAPLKDCLNSNDVWMYDFKGWFRTADGGKCEPLTITDGFSRFLLQCQHMPRKRERDVWNVLERTFHEFGLPLKMRSDNGPPFASLSVGRLSVLSIKLIKIGITPEWIEPGCPEQNGRHERFHLTLKDETAMPPALTLSLQQEKFDQFHQYYNYRRYHEALEQKTPSTVYKPSTRIWNGKFKTPEYSTDHEVRKVGKSGNISWKNRTFFISETLQGEDVGIKEIDVGVMEVCFGPIILGKIDLNKGFKKL